MSANFLNLLWHIKTTTTTTTTNKENAARTDFTGSAAAEDVQDTTKELPLSRILLFGCVRYSHSSAFKTTRKDPVLKVLLKNDPGFTGFTV